MTYLKGGGKSVRIGLIDVDSNIANPALMKISMYYKNRGDEVTWWKGPLFNSTYDKCFASKVFDFTPEPEYMPRCTERGGIAYDIKKVLPEFIDSLEPDYDIYPDCEYSVGFITRGCIRKCKFCKVPEKEGIGVRFDRMWGRFRNPKGKYWMFLDNNILGYKGALEIMGRIREGGLIVDFNQGLDIRLLTPEMAEVLAGIRWYKFIRFAFDQYKDKDLIMNNLVMMLNTGIDPNKLIVYVLIGFGSTFREDMERVELLRSLKVNPYVMVYNRDYVGMDGDSDYLKKFSTWVNYKALFKGVKWVEFESGYKKGKDKDMSRQEEFEFLYG
jgi:hypothetical protein